MDHAAGTDEVAPARPRDRIHWLICALLFAAVVLSYIDRLVLGVLKPQLADLYGWTNSGYGDVTGYFQVCYGIGFLIFGWLIDRLGPKLGYLLAMGSWTIGHFAQTLVTSTTSFVFARLPLAFGEAGTYPAALAAVSQWFPKKERALAIGIFNAGANVGAIVTPLLVSFLVAGLLLGWRWVASPARQADSIAAKSLGVLLDTVGSYQPFFIACGLAYLLALAVVHLLNPRYRPIPGNRLG